MALGATDAWPLLPMPSWPLVLLPQHRVLPPASCAQLWWPPTATDVAVTGLPDASSTCSMLGPPGKLALPSWPESFAPQQCTLPPATAQLCFGPAATCPTLPSETAVGLSRLPPATPSWPSLLLPQQ
jgi:hypothetical protein